MKNELEYLKHNIEYVYNKYEKTDDFTIDNDNYFQNTSNSIVFNSKVDKFIDWYFNNMSQNYSFQKKYKEVEKLRNFIEKMAIMYEIKYPNNSIDKIASSDNLSLKKYSMIDDGTFYRNLSSDERKYLKKPKYPQFIRMRINDLLYEFKLTSNGKIKDFYGNDEIIIHNKDKSFSKFESMNILEFVEMLIEKDFDISKNSIDNVIKVIDEVEKQKYFENELFKSIMFRIVERDRSYYGISRAKLFAKENKMKNQIRLFYDVKDSDKEKIKIKA